MDEVSKSRTRRYPSKPTREKSATKRSRWELGEKQLKREPKAITKKMNRGYLPR
ncbi:MAG: hypothetical protein U0103_26555 [Candidatus Obscuribacterales bacterium]